VTDPDERYLTVDSAQGARLAATINARLAAGPVFSQAELVRRSGVSHPTVRSLMRGEPGRRNRTALRQVANALGWTPGSIEALLDGGEAEPVTLPSDDRLAAIERRMDAFEGELDGIKTSVDGIRALLEELR
jgi:transcriptional regulator with XRE-family HTH domain